MGGAFDPIHNGHLILTESAHRAFNLDGIFFVPSFNPPHRSSQPLATFEDRVKMTELAIAGNSQYCLSEIEKEIGGPGYTLPIIKSLKHKYPKTSWFLILGGDNIAIFDSWYKPEEIIKEVTIIVGGRPGYDAEFKKSIWYNKIKHFDMPPTDISSTTTRQLLKNNQAVDGLLPESVKQFIQEKGLYK